VRPPAVAPQASGAVYGAKINEVPAPPRAITPRAIAPRQQFDNVESIQRVQYVQEPAGFGRFGRSWKHLRPPYQVEGLVSAQLVGVRVLSGAWRRPRNAGLLVCWASNEAAGQADVLYHPCRLPTEIR
jgi:hypothetical protein